MSGPGSRRGRLKRNRPSLRARARPPKQRTQLGEHFTAANLAVALSLQHCGACGRYQYPPREICQDCLADGLVWREAPTGGVLLGRIDLHHSLWEYYKRRQVERPWPLVSARLDCGPVVFAHLVENAFDGVPGSGSRIKVFSHTDASLSAVLFVVAESSDIDTAQQRRELADSTGLTIPSERPGGI